MLYESDENFRKNSNVLKSFYLIHRALGSTVQDLSVLGKKTLLLTGFGNSVLRDSILQGTFIGVDNSINNEILNIQNNNATLENTKIEGETLAILLDKLVPKFDTDQQYLIPTGDSVKVNANGYCHFKKKLSELFPNNTVINDKALQFFIMGFFTDYNKSQLINYFIKEKKFGMKLSDRNLFAYLYKNFNEVSNKDACINVLKFSIWDDSFIKREDLNKNLFSIKINNKMGRVVEIDPKNYLVQQMNAEIEKQKKVFYRVNQKLINDNDFKRYNSIIHQNVYNNDTKKAIIKGDLSFIKSLFSKIGNNLLSENLLRNKKYSEYEEIYKEYKNVAKRVDRSIYLKDNSKKNLLIPKLINNHQKISYHSIVNEINTIKPLIEELKTYDISNNELKMRKKIIKERERNFDHIKSIISVDFMRRQIDLKRFDNNLVQGLNLEKVSYPQIKLLNQIFDNNLETTGKNNDSYVDTISELFSEISINTDVQFGDQLKLIEHELVCGCTDKDHYKNFRNKGMNKTIATKLYIAAFMPEKIKYDIINSIKEIASKEEIGKELTKFKLKYNRIDDNVKNWCIGKLESKIETFDY